MKPRISCITLAVDDLARSVAFYQNGLGFPVTALSDADGSHATLDLGGILLVLISREEFFQFTALANRTAADRGSSECILSYFAPDKATVDTALRRAEVVSGKPSIRADDKSWGYAGYFSDPDGHLWEVVWNPHLFDRRGP